MTADVKADADCSTGAIVDPLVRPAADRLRTESFADVAARQSAPVGYYVETGSEIEISELVGRLMAGIGGWAGFRRSGEFEIGIVDAPKGERVRARFTDVEIIDIDREALPPALEVPAKRVRVAWGVNWTVQDSNVAGSVTEARRTFLREDRRAAEAGDERILRNHPLARDPEIAEAFFDLEADALAEATRRLRLYRVPRSLYRATVKAQPFGLDIGDEIHVTYPRWDLAGGKAGRLVSLDEDTENDLVEVVLFS